MLRPSYTELMEVLNNMNDIDMKVSSRYTIVIAASKRARQLVDSDKPLVSGISSDKAVSIAINEMAQSKIRIFSTKTDVSEAAGDAPPRTDYLSHENLGFE